MDGYTGPWDKGGTIPNTTQSLTTRMVPALGWAAVRVIFDVLLIARGKVTVSSN